ncbi:MAG: hypothetical protein JWM41_4943 [Gemmatimonadetes bacterium]|nr:hypothetical protein [Gemmatimonadota bacterium]
MVSASSGVHIRGVRLSKPSRASVDSRSDVAALCGVRAGDGSADSVLGRVQYPRRPALDLPCASGALSSRRHYRASSSSRRGLTGAEALDSTHVLISHPRHVPRSSTRRPRTPVIAAERMSHLLRRTNGCVAYEGGLDIRGSCREPAWHSLRDAWHGPSAIHRLFSGGHSIGHTVWPGCPRPSIRPLRVGERGVASGNSGLGPPLLPVRASVAHSRHPRCYDDRHFAVATGAV